MESSDTPREPTPAIPGGIIDDALRAFPDSKEAVALIGTALKIAGTPVPEGENDGRRDAVLDLFTTTTPAGRTRVCVLAGIIGELAGFIRAVALETKAEQEDADLVSGDAAVTPDGWLIVTLGGNEIGRVPFDPRRADGAEKGIAEDMLRSYVALHGRGDLEVANATKPPVPGRRAVAMIIVDPAESAPLVGETRMTGDGGPGT